MKRMTVLLLTLPLLLFAAARAESSVYGLLTSLMAGREFTLTVSAEADGDLADLIAHYGQVTCTLHQENDQIELKAVCEGDMYLTACFTAEGVSVDTNLTENGAFQSGWAALMPEVTAGGDEISLRMTGPDHELITFSCRVNGGDLTDCEVEVHIGYITGPGNVHSLWDGITHREGEAGREFYFTFSEEEYGIEGVGTTGISTDGDGTTCITRDEECTVTHNEDEVGTVTFHSTLYFR